MKRSSFLRVGMILGCGVLAACAEPQTVAAPVIAPTAHQADQIYVVVERGQTLDRIAQAFHVPKRDIIAANNLAAPYALKPGTVLAIPGGGAKPPPAASAAKPKNKVVAAAAPEPAEQKPAPSGRARPKRPPPEVIPLD